MHGRQHERRFTTWLERGALLLALISTSGCAMGGGGVGSLALPGPSHSNLGVRANVRADFAVSPDLPNASLGLDTRLLTRSQDDYDWSQWRVSVPVGLTQMPSHSEFMLGYETYVVPSIAQYLTPQGKLRRRITPGLEIGLPIRLSTQRPTWRADDITSSFRYLVPHLEASYFGRDRWEISYGVSFRVRFWSSMVP